MSQKPSIMPQLTIVVADVLMVIGLIAYFATGRSSFTALIPAVLGLILLAAGFVSRKNLKLGTHIALGVALLGALGTLMNVAKIGDLIAGTAERPGAIIASLATFVVLVIYLIIGVRSFLAARRWNADNSVTAADSQ